MSRPPGFNVIGHLSSSSGLANAARSFASVLKANGYPVVGLDVEYTAGAGGRGSNPVEIELARSVDVLPFGYNLVFLSIERLTSMWLRRMPGLQEPRFRNACFLFWELPVLPKPWVPSLALFDALVACSPFVKQVLESSITDVPTIYAEHPLLEPPALESRNSVRERLRIPHDAFLFCASFDLTGDISRKNPLALVEVFRQAFPTDPDVRLLLKCNGTLERAQRHPQLRVALEAISRDPRIHLLVETIPYEAVLALYAASDAYLSFHRAEGLGLGPMEAMKLGKPVAATGFSGNMAYMTEQNSILIPYRLIKTSGSNWQYTASFAGSGAVWAEIDRDAAVDAVQRLRSDPALRERLGSRARRDIAERQETASRAPYVEWLISTLDRSDRVEKRREFARHLRWAERLNPVLMQLNGKAALARFVSRSAPPARGTENPSH